MAWPDAKAKLIEFLETIEISNPFEGGPATLKPSAIYEHAPASIVEDSAFVLYPPAVAVTRQSVRREKVYDVRVRLLIRDGGDSASSTPAALEILDVYRETMIDAFDGWLKLGQALDVSRAEGPNFDEGASYTYGGREFFGQDAHFRIFTSEAREHGA